MELNLSRPITYLITGGETTAATTPSTDDFTRLLKLISAAVAAGIYLIQLREKELSARVLYELTLRAVAFTQGSSTRLLVNDRADIAQAAGANGVHLTANSLSTEIVRRTTGSDFLIGVSTHSIGEACRARDEGADFAVFGPVFQTASKRNYGEPLGLKRLAEVTFALAPFPILALGGVTIDNAPDCLRAGAAGLAGIGLFHQSSDLQRVVSVVRAV
ncbi:MAG: thiE [Acidobacteria bacterium]|nr:thiE [Acidobacteriota bacterium]